MHFEILRKIAVTCEKHFVVAFVCFESSKKKGLGLLRNVTKSARLSEERLKAYEDLIRREDAQLNK